MRLIFFGTGSFGLPTLTALFASKHKVAAVVTQPDREGRGHHRHVNPIKEEGLRHGRTVLQPENVNLPESLDQLRAFKADLFLTAAYGQILKLALLEIPPLGAINLHASLLPKYRGAAPIHAALKAGETETGITVFRIVPKLDAGPILDVERTPIEPHETAGELHDRLAALSVPLTLRVLDGLESGTIREQPQNDSLATYAPQMRKEEGEIHWSAPSVKVLRHVRAMQPWPGAFTTLLIPGRDPLRLSIAAVEQAGPSSEDPQPPGSVLPDEGLLIQTGDAPIRILRLKPSGRREMSAEDFRRGSSLPPGAKLGPPDSP